MGKTCLLILFFFFSRNAFAQVTVSLAEAEAQALANHPQMKLSRQELEQEQILKKGSFSLESPEVFVESPTAVRFAVGARQTFSSPAVYRRQGLLANENIKLAEKNLEINKAELLRNVRVAYLQLQFAQARLKQLQYQDSLFANQVAASARRFKAGETDMLEKINAEAGARQVENQRRQTEIELGSAQRRLQALTGIPDGNPVAEPLNKFAAPAGFLTTPDTAQIAATPLLQLQRQNQRISRAALRLERAKVFPNFTVGYLNQAGPDSEFLYRMQFGISVPIWFWTYSSQINAAKKGIEIAESQYEVAMKNQAVEYQNAVAEFQKQKENVQYYDQTGLAQAGLIISTAQRLFRAGTIDYLAYLQSLDLAFNIRSTYTEALRDYNQSVIQLQFLAGI